VRPRWPVSQGAGDGDGYDGCRQGVSRRPTSTTAPRHVAPTTFSARSAAEGWLATDRRAVETDLIGAGTWTPPKTRETAAKAAQVTLGEYGRQWIAEHQCKPRTRREYENLFAGLIEPALGTVPLRELTPAMVRSWRAALDRRKTPTRTTTAAVLLRTICKTAHADGLIPPPRLSHPGLPSVAASVSPRVGRPWSWRRWGIRQRARAECGSG
jgi:hypothetical protein